MTSLLDTILSVHLNAPMSLTSDAHAMYWMNQRPEAAVEMANARYDPGTIVSSVEEFLAANPGGTLAELAARLALHPRTIRRALQHQGMTFRSLKRAQRAALSNQRSRRKRGARSR